MASGNIISRMLVSLGLDNSKFDSGLKKSEKKTKTFGNSINKIGGLIAGAFALSKVTAFFKTSFKLYGEQIRVEKALRAQIEANGKSADQTLGDYKRFASGLQGLTTVGDETTLKLLQVAESMGASTSESKKAAAGAIGLSKAFGISLETAMRGVILANNGQFEMLQRYIPTLRTANTDTEKAAALNKAMADGMKIAMSEVDSGVGKVEQLSNQWGDFQEQIGGAIAEGGLFQGMLREMSRVVRRLSTDAKDSQLDAIFGDIDINGKTAEARLEGVNSHLERQGVIRQRLIDKEAVLANQGAKAFKDEQGRFDPKLVEAWAIARLSGNKAFNDSLEITKILQGELDSIGTGGDPAKVISVHEELKILNGELALAQRNATQTKDVSLFEQGIKDVDTLTKKIKVLNSQLSVLSKEKPVSINVAPQVTGAVQGVQLPDDQKLELPLKITTEGTFAESDAFVATQAYYQGQLSETQNALNATAMSASAYGSVLGSVGQIAMASGDSQMASILNVAATTLSAVATIIPVLFAKALAESAAAGAGVPFPGNLVAIAAGAAAVIGAFSGLGGGGGGGTASSVTSIDTRGFTSPTTSDPARRTSTVAQTVNVEVTGVIKGKDIALANNQGQKQLKR